MLNIALTGGTSRFSETLKKYFYGKNIFYTTRNEIDILKYETITKFIKRKKIKIFIHLAGLSRPMSIHEKNVLKSIDLNIIGTANVVKACSKYKVKLIYFSTNYVYPGIKGPYKEEHSLLPFNNYGWSKLGGESSVQMYKNSLILRICMTEKPFIHKKAFTNFTTSFIFHENFAKVFKKLIHKKGVINIGGRKQTVYNFAKKNNYNVQPTLCDSNNLDTSVNISKFYSIIK
jgi:dTDP-4-dehydrorhamnose reductase